MSHPVVPRKQRTEGPTLSLEAYFNVFVQFLFQYFVFIFYFTQTASQKK